jgi:DNA mismatch repair protein MutS2
VDVDAIVRASLATLELPKVLEKVAGEATYSLGRERVLDLAPTTDLEEARSRLAFTAEAVRLLDEQPRTTLGGPRDVREPLLRAARGGDLRPSEVVEVLATLRSARSVATQLGALDPERFPRLAALGGAIPVHHELVRRLEEVVDDEGQVLDSASPRLPRLRAEVRAAAERLQQRLRTLVTEYGPFLQEAIVTSRGGRHVIPVRAEARGRVRGIVHDTSASGATLYVEPMAVVELQNQLTEAESQEREEVDRILHEVSSDIGSEASGIRRAMELLAEFDLQLAKARYARLTRAVEPALNDQGVLVLRRARHPLLKGEVVPIDFELGRGLSVVVISGPNTGGKTVALKTVGLITLMAQSGLLVPAAEADIAVREAVLADIGDEQSIEQNLSTFSSHMTRIIAILSVVEEVRRRRPERPPVLVLLDELGAGTDPSEGSALARAILTYLGDRRIATVATTHSSDLKAFAHERPEAVNASVTFDVDTLSPTYRLEIGLPGRSAALAVAERLGLDSRILRGARRHLGSEGVRMEALLRDIERERDAVAGERERLARERQRAEALRADLEAARNRLEDERARILDAARAEAAADLDRLLSELAQIRAETRQGGLDRGAVDRLRRRARRLEERVLPTAPRPRQVAAVPLEGQPELGDAVRVRRLGQVGELIGLSPDGQAEVQLGPLRVRVAVAELERVQRSRADLAAQAPPALPRSQPVPYQLDLRGWRVEDALEELENYLNDAVLSGTSTVRILHGKGTGALRAAIRERLAAHSLVDSSEPAPPHGGGDGVTVVRLSV